MSETLWENEKTLWWHGHSKCFLNFIPYVLDQRYTLYVRSADGEFIAFKNSHNGDERE